MPNEAVKRRINGNKLFNMKLSGKGILKTLQPFKFDNENKLNYF